MTKKLSRAKNTHCRRVASYHRELNST